MKEGILHIFEMSCVKHLFVSLCLLVVAFPAVAGTFKLPDEKAYCSVTIPDSWKPEAYDNGVEALSEDEEVYLAIESTDTGNVEKSMQEAFDYLKKKGVEVDASTAKQEEGKLNGMDVVDLSWDGKDEDGACKVSLTVVSITDEKGLLIIYWASPEGEKKHQSTITKIAQDIKKI